MIILHACANFKFCASLEYKAAENSYYLSFFIILPKTLIHVIQHYLDI